MNVYGVIILSRSQGLDFFYCVARFSHPIINYNTLISKLKINYIQLLISIDHSYTSIWNSTSREVISLESTFGGDPHITKAGRDA